MNIKCGTDIIEISRIKKSIETLGETFINKIYTQNEIAYCESKGNQKYQHYAARFAAKEAAFKATSEIWDNKYEANWKDYEVICDKNGRPNLKITNAEIIENIESMDISLSHCKEYATASVVLLYKNSNESL